MYFFRLIEAKAGFLSIFKDGVWLMTIKKYLIKENRGLSLKRSSPTTRKGLGSSWGSHILGYRGSCDFVTVLACYPVIFSLLDQLAMVAEAPDQHGGGLGRLEDGKNDINVRKMASFFIWFHPFMGIYFFIAVRRGPLNNFCVKKEVI